MMSEPLPRRAPRKESEPKMELGQPVREYEIVPDSEPVPREQPAEEEQRVPDEEQVEVAE